MKTLIICESYHHRNTKKIADAMAEVLHADVKTPGEVDAGALGGFDLIGFGSGIYGSKNHKDLLKLADDLPATDKKAFIFSTAGAGNGDFKGHRELKSRLEAKGFRIVDEFACKGFDTFGPLKFIGGISKGRPNEKDIENAKQFAAKLVASG